MRLSACLGARALVVGVLGRFVVGVPLVNVPWSLCPTGWCAWWWLPACLGGWWLAVTCVPWSSCLGARALVVGVLGRFVVCGYLHALELVPWSFCPAGWCAWWWLPARLEPCALLVAVFLVGAGWRLLVYLGACILLVGVSLVGVLGGGYLHALNLVPCWLVCPCVPWWLVGWRLAVTCVPWSLCLGNFFRPRKVCSLVCGYLHSLELVPCWLLLVVC